jgi:hypothetical protein
MIQYKPSKEANKKVTPLMFLIGGAFVASATLIAYQYAKGKKTEEVEGANQKDASLDDGGYGLIKTNPIEKLKVVEFESSGALKRIYDDRALQLFNLFIYPIAITQMQILSLYVTRDGYSPLNELYKQKKKVPFAPYLGLSTTYSSNNVKLLTSFATLEGVETKSTIDFLNTLKNNNIDNVKLILKTFLSNDAFSDDEYTNSNMGEITTKLKNMFSFYGMNRLAMTLQWIEKKADGYWKKRKELIVKESPSLANNLKEFIDGFDKQRLFAAFLWMFVQRISKIIYREQGYKNVDKSYDDNYFRTIFNQVLREIHTEIGFDTKTYPSDISTKHQGYVWFISAFLDGVFNLEVPYYDRMGFDNLVGVDFKKSIFYEDVNARRQELTSAREFEKFYSESAFIAGAIFWSTSTVKDIKARKI